MWIRSRHKGIQYALEKLGKSKFGFERTAVSNFESKRHEGSGNELVDYSSSVLVLTKRHVGSRNEIGHTRHPAVRNFYRISTERFFQPS